MHSSVCLCVFASVWLYFASAAGGPTSRRVFLLSCAFFSPLPVSFPVCSRLQAGEGSALVTEVERERASSRAADRCRREAEVRIRREKGR